MLDLNDFRFLVEVVDSGSLSAAARTLDRPVSTVSYRIQQLERELGVSLFSRTSRRILLTECGLEFYGHAVATLTLAKEAEAAMRQRCSEPSGAVCFTVADAVAQCAMSEMVSSFLSKFPKIELVQHGSDPGMDIVADRFDFAIRAYSGTLPDSALVQRLLARAPWHLFAAPEYLEMHGTPQFPEDLRSLAVLYMKRDNFLPSWRLTSDADAECVARITLRPRLLGSCVLTLKRSAEMRMGVVALPAFICREEVRSGRLQRVLPGWTAGEWTIAAFMPSRKGTSAAARAFIEHIADAFPQAVRMS